MRETEAASRMRTLDLAYIALFAVLMAACAWVSVPVPKPLVPFTMQTFAVFAAMLCLGGQRGLLSVVVYLLLGAVGVPVFSGFRGGLDALLGTTGGYILGFVGLALAYWITVRLLGDALWAKILGCVLGLVVCYAFGTVWFLRVYAATVGPIGWMAALGWCVFPFLLPDAVKLGMAVVLAGRIGKYLR